MWPGLVALVRPLAVLELVGPDAARTRERILDRADHVGNADLVPPGEQACSRPGGCGFSVGWHARTSVVRSDGRSASRSGASPCRVRRGTWPTSSKQLDGDPLRPSGPLRRLPLLGRRGRRSYRRRGTPYSAPQPPGRAAGYAGSAGGACGTDRGRASGRDRSDPRGGVVRRRVGGANGGPAAGRVRTGSTATSATSRSATQPSSRSTHSDPGQSGMFPCFRLGPSTRLVSINPSASQRTGRVRRGSITPST